jgi:lysozyme
MKTSQQGVEFIAAHEGSVKKNGLHWIYDDHTGRPINDYNARGFATIGYGHLITEAEKRQGLFLNGINEEQALDLLSRDLSIAEGGVLRAVKVPLTQNEFDALVSFTFNVGAGNLNSSTLLRLLNAGNKRDVPAQFLRWDKSKGVVLQGLVRRRRDEANLFSQGVYAH